MMLRTDMDHLSGPMRGELHRIVALLFEAFAESCKGRLSERYRVGSILKLILHGVHAHPEGVGIVAGEAVHLTAIVSNDRLARREKDWLVVRDRLRRGWEFGEIAHPVRLAVYSLNHINRALVRGVPHFVTLATEGIALHEMGSARLASPRHLPEPERTKQAGAEFDRWHARASGFLDGARFYHDRGDAPMAALLLHHTCEHLYQCIAWTLTLHGRRTHALDELREVAEALDARLCAAWPRETPFERRVFACLRRAYVEVRYGRGYRISAEELAWAMVRTDVLHRTVAEVCTGRLATPACEPLEVRDDRYADA